MDRRGWLGRVAAGVAASVCAASSVAEGTEVAHSESTPVLPGSFSHCVDLTHALTPSFPTFSGQSQFELEQRARYSQSGFYSKNWKLAEHTGTHMDAPIHTSEGAWDAASIPTSKLVLPLCVVDIRDKAAASPDAPHRLRQPVLPADLLAVSLTRVALTDKDGKHGKYHCQVES